HLSLDGRHQSMNMDVTSPAPTPSPDSGLPTDIAICHQMIHELVETLQAPRREMEQVRHRLSLILQRLYGPRKERINPAQLLLFADALAAALPEAAPANDEADEEPAPAVSPRRRGHGRQKLPKDLLRIPVVHDLTEAEKACPNCGQLRQKIGEVM